MRLKRTTLRIREDLMKEAKSEALEADASLQEVVNNALWYFLREKKKAAKKRVKKLALKPKPLGFMDNLTRNDIYD